ncbi:outer membrane protein assembly factor BamB family protein [Streptomyces apocyni]|uniref:outer membrane protein assembly factor BamB family protein n=1 Tax=Streptomyces apocyni TaxID=2654677 RepID=UPI0012E9D5AF|nr:PQQ-binding-like beta-propeller repeat protein [Streptomyces apocyni]
MVLTTALAAALVLTACGGSDGDESSPGKSGDPKAAGKPPAAAEPEIREFDAPLRFSVDKPISLPGSAGEGKVSLGGLQHPLPVTLHKGVAFIARPDGMEVFNGYRASDPVMITPEHEPLVRIEDLGPLVGGNPAEAPVIAEHGGKTFALSSLVASVPGSGTTKGHQVVELIAVDTAQATKAWSVEIELGERHYSADEDETEVVGYSGDMVVVYAQSQVFGVDLGSHQKVWAAKGTYAKAPVLVGDTVVAETTGMSEGRPVGLSLSDGRQKWTMESVSPDGLAVAGKATVMVSGYDSEAQGRRGLLVDAATGKRVRAYEGRMRAEGCAYDGVSTTVCGDGGSAVAYDSQTGEARWTLPDDAQGRVAPKVTLVREGLVYGTTENGPVVIDAMTGKDKEAQPGVAPYVTDGYVGIGLAEEDKAVTAYRTAG